LRRIAASGENGLFAGLFNAGREARVLLAMQKVEGSNPFSRFEKGLHLQAFCFGQSDSASASADNE
jgi:hypothetical protein